MASLLIKLKSGQKKIGLPSSGSVTIGASEKSLIRIRDPFVSKEHCQIVKTPKGYIIQDLGSHNGTFVNKERISRSLLKDGDSIRVGRIVMVFSDTGEGPRVPKVARPRLRRALSQRPLNLPQRTSPVLIWLIGLGVLGGVIYAVLRPFSGQESPREYQAEMLLKEARHKLRYWEVSEGSISDQVRKGGRESKYEAVLLLQRILQEYGKTSSAVEAKRELAQRGLKEFAEREQDAREQVPVFIEKASKANAEQIEPLLDEGYVLLKRILGTSLEFQLRAELKVLEEKR
jgi:pSer/pThr/pTyr-binding forkhead associated (FHA) protein